MHNGIRVLDCHVHYALPILPDTLHNTLEATATDMVNLVVIPHRYRVSSTPEALMYKHAHPENTYAFTCLDVSAYFRAPKRVGQKQASFVQNMLAAGCDGVKLIEGKPDMRRVLPIPDFDAPVWEPFWRYMEKQQVPILWHVNDPEEFWDAEAIPAFAKDNGWFYGPETINNEEQYRQVEAVLGRHPQLKIIFAHFFFMSKQIPRLRDWMERFPNMCVDLTPGIELYANLSACKEDARAFFMRFQDRILYGTDIGARSVIKADTPEISLEESLRRTEICRNFLSSNQDYVVKADEEFLIGGEDFTLRCLDLPIAVQRKIYSENFLSFVGGTPRSVHPKRVKRECVRIGIAMRRMFILEKGFRPDDSAINKVLAYFRGYTDS